MKTSREWASISEEQRRVITAHQNELPIAVGAIARDFGIKVMKSTMPGSISGEIREVDGVVTIKVNRHDVKERQRFTIAHEIAHFLLHKDRLAGGIEDDVLYRSRLSDELEREANRLAADIVMPAHLVSAAMQENKNLKVDERQKKVAEKAEVSIAAIKIRTGG